MEEQERHDYPCRMCGHLTLYIRSVDGVHWVCTNPVCGCMRIGDGDMVKWKEARSKLVNKGMKLFLGMAFFPRRKV